VRVVTLAQRGQETEYMQRFTDNGDFDVVVIGGGISGAAVAYEAASRGLRVALFEKGDFSAATSAASSKLIHGGLRYLSNLEFGLVRESLKERRIMTNIAPNFVYPLPFLFPHYRGALKENKWFIKLGLTLYDLLAFDRQFTWEAAKKIPRHRTLGTRAARQRMPVLKPEGLTGASIYYDCLSIAPERLALAFIQSAAHHQAQIANYAAVTGFLRGADGKSIRGVKVFDQIAGHTHEVQAKVTINCAGPWTDNVLSLVPGMANASPRQRSEGIHIVTRPLIPPGTAVGAMVPGGRHCFLIPWRGHTLIGTTDEPYHGPPDDYRVTRAGIQALIDTVNTAFFGLRLNYADVLHCYGGLRPLVDTPASETYNASRRYEIHDHQKEGLRGLITVEGGKWTTSRHLAEKVVDRLVTATALPVGHSVSARQYLNGCAIHDMNAHIARLNNRYPDFDDNTLDNLGRLYGTACEAVLELARMDKSLAEKLNDEGEILAQAVYAVRYEMAQTLLDIVLRRTGLATLGHPGEQVLQRVAAAAAPELNWNRDRIAQEIQTTMHCLAIPAR
jgi:glycerol-3-phosphate dehydrogenase